MSILTSIFDATRNILGGSRQIGEEEFKQQRRTSREPVVRSGACYVPMEGYEHTKHYRDKQNLHHLGRYEWAVSVLREEVGSRRRVLDAACGVGYGSRKLAEIFDRVDAVDRFEEAVEMGRKRYAHPNVQWYCMDVAHLGEKFEPASYDAIVSFQTIESVDDDEAFLDDLKVLLRPGGLLLIDTPLRNVRVERPENRHHKRYYSIDDWMDLLSDRFEIRAFGDLPNGKFLERCLLPPSSGAIVACTKPSSGGPPRPPAAGGNFS